MNAQPAIPQVAMKTRPANPAPYPVAMARPARLAASTSNAVVATGMAPTRSIQRPPSADAAPNPASTTLMEKRSHSARQPGHRLRHRRTGSSNRQTRQLQRFEGQGLIRHAARLRDADSRKVYAGTS